MTVFIAPDPTRSFFERVVKSVSGTFGITEDQVKNDFVLSPETVLIGNKLKPNQSTYQFSPRNNVGPSIETDNRLDQNDYFAIQSIGLKLSKADYDVDTAAASNWGNHSKFSFPVATVFNGTAEAAALLTIVNGKYSFTVGSQQIIPQDITQKLFYLPLAGNAGVDELPYNGNADPGTRGLYSLPMNFILDLNQDNLINIVLANGVTTNIDGSVDDGGDPSTVRNYLWVELEGIVIKNMGGNRQGSMSC